MKTHNIISRGDFGISDGYSKVKYEHFYHTIPSPQELSYKDFYSYMAQSIPDGGRFVEVGVYHGRSFAYFIVEMLNAGKKFDCVAVDACPWDGEPCIGFHKHMVPLEGHFRTHFERVDSFVAAKNFEDESIDFCFIDANHTYPFVIQDIRAYIPKMKSGGVISGHDLSDNGVRTAVEEVFGENYSSDIKQDIWYVQL